MHISIVQRIDLDFRSMRYIQIDVIIIIIYPQFDSTFTYLLTDL